MENHFLLKCPDKLQTIIENQIKNKTYDFEIYTKNNDVVFKINNKEYKTIYYDIPTVIEIQKTMDKTQFYKAGNVSNCLYVIDEESNEEACNDKEIEKNIENKGKEKGEDTENVDKYIENVYENLDKDIENVGKETVNQAAPTNKIKGQIITNEDVYKLEKDVLSHKIDKKYNKQTVKKFMELSGISPCLRYCKIKRFKSKPQVFMKSQEQEQKVKQLLERERMSTHTEIVYIGEDETSDVSSLAAEIEINLDNEDKKVMRENIKNKKNMLNELEERIKGKEQQLETVNNLIMKKRFMDNINALKSEYETLLSEITELEKIEK